MTDESEELGRRQLRSYLEGLYLHGWPPRKQILMMVGGYFADQVRQAFMVDVAEEDMPSGTIEALVWRVQCVERGSLEAARCVHAIARRLREEGDDPSRWAW